MPCTRSLLTLPARSTSNTAATPFSQPVSGERFLVLTYRKRSRLKGLKGTLQVCKLVQGSYQVGELAAGASWFIVPAQMGGALK